MTDHSMIVRIYATLLRLYPRRFRMMFADEMIEVFTTALKESREKGGLTMVDVVGWEMLHFPLSVIREQWRERGENHIWEPEPMGNPALYRLCIILLMAGIFVYVGLVIAPFFIYGIHQQPYFQIIGGRFDPKGYPLFDYQTVLGSLINIIAVTTMISAPIWTIGFGAAMGIELARRWRWMLRGQRWLGLTLLIANISLLVFSFSPLGQLIIAWHMD